MASAAAHSAYAAARGVNAGRDHQQRRGDVERGDPHDVLVDPVEQRRVNSDHDQVAQRRARPCCRCRRAANPRGIASPATRKPAMPSSSRSRSGVRSGARVLVSQAYPPYIHHSTPKTSSTSSRAGRGEVVREQRGELGEGEREDQVEEQLQGADPQRRIARVRADPGAAPAPGSAPGSGFAAGPGSAAGPRLRRVRGLLPPSGPATPFGSGTLAGSPACPFMPGCAPPAAVAAMSLRNQPPRIRIRRRGRVGRGAGGRQVRPGAHHVEHPATARHKAARPGRWRCPRAGRKPRRCVQASSVPSMTSPVTGAPG